jgi:hypothetical protein
LSRQHPPPQHWLMSFVAVSPSPSIRLMSVGLSDMSVVEARRGRVCPVKFTAAAGRSCSLSTTSSTAVSGSVAGVTGASDSSLLVVPHAIDPPNDFGDVCSGCDCVSEGRRESWGIERGSEGIGSSGCDVDVVGMLWLAMLCVDVAIARCVAGRRSGVWWWVKRVQRAPLNGATLTRCANHG